MRLHTHSASAACPAVGPTIVGVDCKRFGLGGAPNHHLVAPLLRWLRVFVLQKAVAHSRLRLRLACSFTCVLRIVSMAIGLGVSDLVVWRNVLAFDHRPPSEQSEHTPGTFRHAATSSSGPAARFLGEVMRTFTTKWLAVLHPPKSELRARKTILRRL